MEVSLLRGSNNTVEKPTLRSNPPHSPTSTPDELILAEQESDSCKHFTIRGFVSEVRKRNAKICWPFSMLNNTLDKDVNPLRPLSVKKFRQWGCQNCIREIINPKTSIANGANANQKDEVKNKSTLLLRDDIKASHRKTTKSLGRSLPQSDQENNLEGILVQDDNSTRIITGGWCPLSCCSKKDGTSPTTDSPKGDMRVSKLGYHGLKGNRNLRGKPDAVAAEEQSSVRANSSEISLLSKGTPKLERTALIHRTGGISATSEQVLRSLSFSATASNIEQKQGLIKLGKRKESDSHFSEGRMPPRVDAASPDNGALPAASAHVSRYNSMESDECSDEASDTSVPLIRDLLACQNDDRKLGMSMEKSRTRRSRKMRALDDIMKSQRIESDEKNCISSDIGGPSGSGNNEIPAVSEQRNDNPNDGNHQIQNNEPTLMKKHKKESIPNDGEGICLIRWLKKAPKKVSLHRGLEESSRIDTATSSKKVLDLNVPLSGLGENKQETTAEKDQNMTEVEVLKSSFMIQEGSTAHKGCAISDQDPMAKNSHPKSVGIIISEKRRSQQLESHDNDHKKSPVSYKKIKGALAEDESFSQQCFEDSLGTQKQPGFQVQVEAKKKKNSMRISEQEAVDSIPMDIVELLAKKQQERHLTNTKYDSADMSRPLKITGHTMNSNAWDSTEAYSSKESEASNRCLYQKGQCNIAGYSCWTSVRNNEDGECQPKPYLSCMRDKQHHQFDLNQEAPACSMSELQASSPYIGLSMSGGQLIVDTGRNYSPRQSSINGMQMPPFLSHHTYTTISPDRNLFSNALDGSYGLRSGCPSQINAQKAFSNLQSNIMYPRENPKALAHDISHQTSVYPSKNWAESSNHGGASAAKHFAESGNAYYSNVRGPMDLHNNETISASNLLRLIQQSASLGEPCHPLIHYDSIGHIRALNGHGGDLLVSATDPTVFSRDNGNHELDKRAENLCRPLRPLPRFGILGPLLQKEITNTSLSSALGFGASIPGRPIFCKTSSVAGQTDALASSRSIPKGEPEACKLVHVTKVLNAQTSSSQCEGLTRIDSSGLPLGNPQLSPAKDSIRQVVTGSRDGAFQPVRSTCKMEECVVNRNPADFAMPDEDSEYMIGYQEKNAEGTPLSGSQPLQSHLHGRKGQKMRKLNDLNRSRMGNKSPSRRLSFTRKAT